MLTEKEKVYVMHFKFSSSQFHSLPMVHKSEITENVLKAENSEYIQVHCPNDLKRTAITGGPESPTQRLSEIIEILLKPQLTQETRINSQTVRK